MSTRILQYTTSTSPDWSRHNATSETVTGSDNSVSNECSTGDCTHSSKQQIEQYKRLLYLSRILELLISHSLRQYDIVLASDLGHYLPESSVLFHSKKTQQFASHLNKLLSVEYSILDAAEEVSQQCETKIHLPKIRLKQRDTRFLLNTRAKVVKEILKQIKLLSASSRHRSSAAVVDHVFDLEREHGSRIAVLKEFE